MLSMGITLSPKDFVNVLKRPNAVLVGFVFCYGMMPALAYGLGVAAGLSPPLLAGLVLIGCINGGQASNLCTFIANGNVRHLDRPDASRTKEQTAGPFPLAQSS